MMTPLIHLNPILNLPQCVFDLFWKKKKGKLKKLVFFWKGVDLEMLSILLMKSTIFQLYRETSL